MHRLGRKRESRDAEMDHKHHACSCFFIWRAVSGLALFFSPNSGSERSGCTTVPILSAKFFIQGYYYNNSFSISCGNWKSLKDTIGQGSFLVTHWLWPLAGHAGVRVSGSLFPTFG
jgi:hypothetical protein